MSFLKVNLYTFEIYAPKFFKTCEMYSFVDSGGHKTYNQNELEILKVDILMVLENDGFVVVIFDKDLLTEKHLHLLKGE